VIFYLAWIQVIRKYKTHMWHVQDTCMDTHVACTGHVYRTHMWHVQDTCTGHTCGIRGGMYRTQDTHVVCTGYI